MSLNNRRHYMNLNFLDDVGMQCYLEDNIAELQTEVKRHIMENMRSLKDRGVQWMRWRCTARMICTRVTGDGPPIRSHLNFFPQMSPSSPPPPYPALPRRQRPTRRAVSRRRPSSARRPTSVRRPSSARRRSSTPKCLMPPPPPPPPPASAPPPPPPPSPPATAATAAPPPSPPASAPPPPSPPAAQQPSHTPQQQQQQQQQIEDVSNSSSLPSLEHYPEVMFSHDEWDEIMTVLDSIESAVAAVPQPKIEDILVSPPSFEDLLEINISQREYDEIENILDIESFVNILNE